MRHASAWFTKKDRERIAKAVADAEKKTSGEIVPVVATASSRYERAEGLGGIALALITLTTGWLLWQEVVPARGEWALGYEPALDLPIVLALVIVGFFVGSFAVRGIPPLRRLLAGRRRMRTEVTHEAARAFERFHVGDTKGGTGIIIYISLFERKVCVLGDKPISRKVAEAEWRDLCDTVTRGIADGKYVDGLVAAIGKCGDILGRHFPIKPDDVNELSNELHLID